MIRRLTLMISLVAAVATFAACAAPAATPEVPIPSGAVVLSAKDLKFSTDQLLVPAGKAFSLVLRNEEQVPHNIAITTQDNGGGSVLFRFDPITGTTGTFEVPAIPAGTYFFRCDVHPQMHGRVVAQ